MNHFSNGKDQGEVGVAAELSTQRKIGWVTDYIHGTVPVSALEKRVISTQIFNRLHNILQNSTVYLTYPSNRTSRFSHSIGCMHIAGEIFRNSMLNAHQDYRKRFLVELAGRIDRLDKGSELNLITGGKSRFDQKTNMAGLEDPIYQAALPGSLDHSEKRSYILGYQALRIVALLHDLGHPPFSHVSEHAIDDISEELKAAEGEPTQDIENFSRIVDFYSGPTDAFHETLGARLTRFILDGIIRETGEVSLARSVNILEMKYLVLAIFQARSGEGVLGALHGIVDGDLDADRLDYVPRDISMSGTGKEQGSYDRLLPSFDLLYVDEMPVFLPSVRALSTLEEFFQKRLNLYKYVVFHHRVAKTDGLLRSVVVQLAKRSLLTNNEKVIEVNKKFLEPHVSGLWLPLDPDLDFDDQVVANYIQWDDSWLLSVMRRAYFTLLEEKEQAFSKKLPPEDELLFVQLEEVLSNKKHYGSLFKRVDSFIEVDDAFIGFLGAGFSWQGVSELVGAPLQWDNTDDRDQPKKNELLNLLKSHHHEYHSRSEDSKERVSRERSGLFLARLLELLRIALGKKPTDLVFVRQALRPFQEELAIQDVIVRPTVLKSGVGRNFLLAMGDRAISLGEVSRIADELGRSANLYPPFYIFLLDRSRNGDSEDDGEYEKRLGTFRHLLAEKLAASFKTFVGTELKQERERKNNTGAVIHRTDT